MRLPRTGNIPLVKVVIHVKYCALPRLTLLALNSWDSTIALWLILSLTSSSKIVALQICVEYEPAMP